MSKCLTILCIVIASSFVNNSRAAVILVTNTADSGIGSLRNSFDLLTINDTILIDVKGTISIESQINIISKSNFTIIGPYPKHITITSGSDFSGSILNFESCSNITISGIGFVGGNGNTRHIRMLDCTGSFTVNQCLFEGNSILTSGAAIEVDNSTVSITKCSFINNTADIGGAINVSNNAFLIIENCTFSENHGNTKTGALRVSSGADVEVRFSSFFNNSAASDPQLIETGIGTNISFENVAVANNGGGLNWQFTMEGTVISHGGNCIKLNLMSESTGMPPDEPGDYTSYSSFTTGIRTAIKIDGFGLKYWPIINGGSTFINRTVATAATPDYDCRNAPRNLGGGTMDFFPDAGACEYTHLRVTTTSGSSITSGSFLWALSPAQRIDPLHYIEFDISGAPGPINIDTEGALSTMAYIIDGFSQDNSAIPGPTIGEPSGLTPATLPINIINNSLVSEAFNIDAGAENSIIQGLRIQNFDAYGMTINTSDISVYGCEIGIDALGNENGNLKSGIKITTNDNIIGGTEHFNRNVLSGNGLGIELEQSNITVDGGEFNLIAGNIIGGNSDGISLITAGDQTLNGIFLKGSLNTIGLTALNGKNIIIDNKNGVLGSELANNNLIQHNYIGIGWNASSAFGNSISGVFLEGSDNNQIGGYNSNYANIIANNAIGIGMRTNITAAIENLIIGNSIYNNTGQGIDLENDGIVIPNDGLMDDSEQNSGIDYPELIKSESCDLIETITTYQLSVPTGLDYRVEFYTIAAPDALNGEGDTLIGITTVSVITNPQTFTFSHDELIPTGTTITATVTQISSNNTSEFGTNVTAQIKSGDPSISYADFCPDEVPLPNFDGDTGGTFRFMSPEPGDGELIDELTGELIGEIEGTTYHVIYGFPVCTNEDTATFSIILVEEEFTFEDFCVIGDEAGNLPIAADPDMSYFLLIDAFDGATIDISTGLISNPVEGTAYTVVDSAVNFGCWQADTVIVNAILVDESFSFDNICYGDIGNAYDIATIGGVFSFNPDPFDGAILTTDGELSDGQTGATYTVKYLVSNEGCFDSLEVLVEIITVNTSFSFDDFCPGETSPAPIPEIEGGTFLFSSIPDFDEIIDPISGIISGPVEDEIYSVIYTDTIAGCVDSDTIEVYAILVDQSFIHTDFCWEAGSSEAIPTVDGGVFSFGIPLPIDDALINSENGQISDASEGTPYEIVYTLTVASCTQSDSLIITAIGVDESFVFEDFCPSITSPTPIPTTGGGIFTFSSPPGDGATIDGATGIISNGVEGNDYSVLYTVMDESALCTESSIEIISVISIDESFVFEDFCAEFNGIPISVATGGGEFSLIPPIDGDAVIDAETGNISSANPGSYYTIEYTVGLCMESDTIIILAKGTDTAEFNMDNFCSNIETFPEITGTLGGTFDFDPDPIDAATIDESTGLITSENGGDYSVRYISEGTDFSCSDTMTLLVSVFPVPEIITMYSELDIYCPENEIESISIIEENNIDKVYWYKNDIDGDPIDSLLSYLPDTLYLGDNVFYVQPMSAEGCIGDLNSYTLFLSDTSGMYAGLDKEICKGSSAIIDAYGGSNYEWITDVPLSDKTAAIQQSFSINEEIYIVKISNSENCAIYDTIAITFLPEGECNIEVFNAFSPNEDGKNDFWYIENLINFIPNTVYIYNRWGNEINAFEDYDNLNVYWDGTDERGNQLPPGTYYYVVITEREKLNQAGWVQIVR